MEWIVKLICFIKRETWWRPHYRRITLSENMTHGGKCLLCHAGTPKDTSIRCDILKGRDCPCKDNQYLKLKQNITL